MGVFSDISGRQGAMAVSETPNTSSPQRKLGPMLLLRMGSSLRWNHENRVFQSIRRSLRDAVFGLLRVVVCLSWLGASPAVAADAVLDCGHVASLTRALPAASAELTVAVAADVPTHAVLEVREAGQDLLVESAAPQRSVQTPPRYGTTVFRVQQPMRLAIKRLRPGRGAGAVALILHCDPGSAGAQWQWFGPASELAGRFTGGVGSLREDFPDALLSEVTRSAVDERTRALAEHLTAQTLLLAGRAADASAAFALAAQAWQRIGDGQRASAARVGIAEDRNRSGQYEDVLRLAREAPSAPDGSHYFGVRLENARCLALHYLHQLDQATACYAWTTSRLDALDETLELASTGIDFAEVEQARGNSDAAQRLLLDSLALAQGAQALTVQGRAQFALAGLARDQGNIAEALQRLQQAQERFAAAAEPRWQANALLRLAALLSDLRAPGDARAAIRRALTLLDVRHAPARVAAAQWLLAQIELNDGQPEAGLREVDIALRLYRELDMPAEVARAQLLQAQLLLRAGRDDEARVAIAAEADDAPRHATADAAQRGLIRAELALHAGNFEQAVRLLHGLASNLTWGEQLERTRLLAEAEWRAGRRGKAQARLRAHARRVLMLSRRTDNALLAHTLRASTGALLQAAIDLLAQALDAGTANNEPLLQWLLPWLLDPDDAARRDAQHQPASRELNAPLSALLLADSAPGDAGKLAADGIDFALLQRLASAADAPDAASAEHALDFAALATLAQPGRPVLALLQGRHRALRLWVQASVEPRLERIDLRAVHAQLEPLRALLAHPDSPLAQIDAHARALSEQVFGGLGERAAPERLQVVGGRLSAAIPWPVLYWPQRDQPLAQRTAVVLLRLTTTVAPRRTAPERIAVLLAAQDTDTAARGLPALSAAAVEPALIQRSSPNRQVITRAAASREQALFTLAEPGAWLHVSAHGSTQTDRLLASGLWLSPQDGSNDPQFLGWADLFEQGVGADLVVLDACQLAQSDGAAAHAALDFAAAVSRAGAHHTIAAQWPVSDTASAVWVPAFYHALAAAGDHPDPARALAEARRALRASRAFRHPFHWAGWVHWQRVAVADASAE